jgi:hypothetical protein
MRHGLLSKEVLLPGEDADALQELDENLRAELPDRPELENLLVDRITAAVWRLRRLGRVEAGIFAREQHEELAERAVREVRTHEVSDSGFFGPEIAVTDQAKHEEAISEARRIRGEQEHETVTLGRTFARAADGVNAFSELSRYETAIERQLYEAPGTFRRPWPWTLMFQGSQKATVEIWLCFVILCREV